MDISEVRISLVRIEEKQLLEVAVLASRAREESHRGFG